MIKDTELYPGSSDHKFDIDYFRKTHIPMVAGLLGDALKGGSVEVGVAHSKSDLYLVLEI